MSIDPLLYDEFHLGGKSRCLPMETVFLKGETSLQQYCGTLLPSGLA
jgi:hypothetical protein